MAWLYEPKDKQALGDVAKLAVALRSGNIPGPFLDEGFAEVALGTVGRVQLLSPVDIGLAPAAAAARKFALARGTTQLCLAEIVAGPAGATEAQAHVDAVALKRGTSDGKGVVGWLIAEALSDEARAILKAAGSVGTSTKS